MTYNQSAIARSRDRGTHEDERRFNPSKEPPALKLGILDERVGYFVRRLQVAIFKDFIRTLAPMDVRPAQYSVLTIIAENPGRSQAVIGKALAISRAPLVRMLHKLERRKWVVRRNSCRDGRSNHLFLTPTGQKALTRINSLVARHEARMAELLGEERRNAVIRLLKDFG